MELVPRISRAQGMRLSSMLGANGFRDSRHFFLFAIDQQEVESFGSKMGSECLPNASGCPRDERIPAVAIL